jgi:hypothetical protein
MSIITSFSKKQKGECNSNQGEEYTSSLIGITNLHQPKFLCPADDRASSAGRGSWPLLPGKPETAETGSLQSLGNHLRMEMILLL